MTYLTFHVYVYAHSSQGTNVSHKCFTGIPIPDFSPVLLYDHRPAGRVTESRSTTVVLLKNDVDRHLYTKFVVNPLDNF